MQIQTSVVKIDASDCSVFVVAEECLRVDEAGLILVYFNSVSDEIRII